MNIDVTNKEVIEFLISEGFTPPWNYNMDEAPKDGEWILLKSSPLWIGDKGVCVTIGSWRVDEGGSGDLNPLWLDNTFDPKRPGYASTPITPIAWKPIVV